MEVMQKALNIAQEFRAATGGGRQPSFDLSERFISSLKTLKGIEQIKMLAHAIDVDPETMIALDNDDSDDFDMDDLHEDAQHRLSVLFNMIMRDFSNSIETKIQRLNNKDGELTKAEKESMKRAVSVRQTVHAMLNPAL